MRNVALLLTGGKGKRLYLISKLIPKPLIPFPFNYLSLLEFWTRVLKKFDFEIWVNKRILFNSHLLPFEEKQTAIRNFLSRFEGTNRLVVSTSVFLDRRSFKTFLEKTNQNSISVLFLPETKFPISDKEVRSYLVSSCYVKRGEKLSDWFDGSIYFIPAGKDCSFKEGEIFERDVLNREGFQPIFLKHAFWFHIGTKVDYLKAVMKLLVNFS